MRNRISGAFTSHSQSGRIRRRPHPCKVPSQEPTPSISAELLPWFDPVGKTPKVAMEHHLQVRDEDFAKAVGGQAQTASLSCAAPALRNTSETPSKASHGFESEKQQTPCFTGNACKTRGC